MHGSAPLQQGHSLAADGIILVHWTKAFIGDESLTIDPLGGYMATPIQTEPVGLGRTDTSNGRDLSRRQPGDVILVGNARITFEA